MITERIEEQISLSKPDYQYWAMQINWTIEEAVALLINVAPNTSFPELENSYGRKISLKEMMYNLQNKYDFAVKYVQYYETLSREWGAPIFHTLAANSPHYYLEWATKRHIPISEELTNAVSVLQQRNSGKSLNNSGNLSYCTPDMQLMFDAVDKFWRDYDLEKPNPSSAPFKKDVVEWLKKEAEKRNMDSFSTSRAEVMDTIIRCPASRRGGNTQ